MKMVAWPADHDGRWPMARWPNDPVRQNQLERRLDLLRCGEELSPKFPKKPLRSSMALPFSFWNCSPALQARADESGHRPSGHRTNDQPAMAANFISHTSQVTLAA